MSSSLLYRLTAPIAFGCVVSLITFPFPPLPHHISWPFFLMLCVFYAGNATIIQQTALPLSSLLRQCLLCMPFALYSPARQCLSLSARLPFSPSFSLPFPCPHITENSLPACYFLVLPKQIQSPCLPFSCPLLSDKGEPGTGTWYC